MSDPARLFIALYTDEDITSELAPALRERGFEAQSVMEAGLLQAGDARQLAYAVDHGMTLLTCNASHFLMLARQYAADGQAHAGIIISSEQYSRRRFGELLRLTLRVMNTLTVDDMRNALEQFPSCFTGARHCERFLRRNLRLDLNEIASSQTTLLAMTDRKPNWNLL